MIEDACLEVMKRSGRSYSVERWGTDLSQWVCCWGEHRWDEVQGFGNTPYEAIYEAYKQGVASGLDEPA